MYWCESWTIKKAERTRIDAFELWCWEKTLESPLDSKEIKPVNPKGNQPWIFIGRTDAEAPVLWPSDAKSWLNGKHPDAGKDWGQKEKRMRWLDGRLGGMSLSKLQEIVKDEKAWRGVVHGVTKSQTRLSNWTTTTRMYHVLSRLRMGAGTCHPLGWLWLGWRRPISHTPGVSPLWAPWMG